MKFSTFINRYRDARRYESIKDINSKGKNKQSKYHSQSTTINSSRSVTTSASLNHNITTTDRNLNQTIEEEIDMNWQDYSNYSNSQWDDFESYDEAKTLREENLELKQRLNAANNTIRDLEYVCNRNDDTTLCKGQDTSSTKLFCSFLLPKKQTQKRDEVVEKLRFRKDDRSVFSTSGFSQASTVKTGSLTRPKKSRERKQRENRDRNILMKNQHNARCLNSFTSCSLTGTTRKNASSSTPSLEIDNVETETAPSSPDRSPPRTRMYQSKDTLSSRNVDPSKTSYFVQDNRSRIHVSDNPDFQNFGVRTYQSSSLIPVQQRLQKMNFLTQAAMKTIPLRLMDIESGTERPLQRQGNLEGSFQNKAGPNYSTVKSCMSELDSSTASSDQTDETDNEARIEI